MSHPTKTEIFEAALDVARVQGYNQITRKQIAARAKVSEGLVSYHFSTMANLRRDIVREAILQKDLPIIAQAIVAGESLAKLAPLPLKKKALAYAAG